MDDAIKQTQLAVVGAGPGGYAAAFHAADLGLRVTLIDLDQNPGGVCLYKGCIPSKALLHASRILSEAREAEAMGIHFNSPKINLEKLKSWKDSVVEKLAGGLGDLCRMRKIDFIQARASFLDSQTLLLQSDLSQSQLKFEQVILATGSRPNLPSPFDLESSRLWTSTQALELNEIPRSLLVVGGGYIGLEMGTVYATLGSQVTAVEMGESLLPGVDKDLVRILSKRIENLFSKILLNTQVTQLKEEAKGMAATLESKSGEKNEVLFDTVLVAVGRKPNSSGLGLGNTKVELDPRGFVKVDESRRTSAENIFAIGDLTGEPMLAHKASQEGWVAAEVAAGRATSFEPQAIPAVVFTDPEIAWCGLTETQAKEEKKDVIVSRFPWAASGRALTLNRPEGLTKLVVERESQLILGMGIVGPGAGELIAEGVLAIEMGATATDLQMTIHPHPTLSETLKESAEGVEGSSVYLYKPARK